MPVTFQSLGRMLTGSEDEVLPERSGADIETSNIDACWRVDEVVEETVLPDGGTGSRNCLTKNQTMGHIKSVRGKRGRYGGCFKLV
jgi:hypothetical protein